MIWFSLFSLCMTGPQGDYCAVLRTSCGQVDFDADGDVDLRDFAALQNMSVPRLSRQATKRITFVLWNREEVIYVTEEEAKRAFAECVNAPCKDSRWLTVEGWGTDGQPRRFGYVWHYPRAVTVDGIPVDHTGNWCTRHDDEGGLAKED